MRLVSKDSLVYTRGYICTKAGEVVGLEPNVEKELIALNAAYQEAWDYMRKAEAISDVIKAQDILNKMDNVKPWSILDEYALELPEVETPVLDAHKNNQERMMKEIDQKIKHEKEEKVLSMIPSVVQFMQSKEVFVTDNPQFLDLPHFDPIKMDEITLLHVVEVIARIEIPEGE